MFKQVSIIGLGLIGGSYAYAIKKQFPTTSIHGIARRQATLDEATRAGLLSKGSLQIDGELKNSQLIIIATPIDHIVEDFKKIEPFLSAESIVIDVASTKRNIVEAILPLDMRTKSFIGTHPMAGKEKIGFEYASAELLSGAKCVLVKTHVSAKKRKQLEAFIGQLGMIPVFMKASDHDKAVAAISHLPYIIACSLVDVLRAEEKNQDTMKLLAATGFKDTTRIASSDPAWGIGIAKENKKELLRALAAFEKSLKKIKIAIKHDDYDALQKTLNAIQQTRNGMYQ